jgi:hypothetical protein
VACTPVSDSSCHVYECDYRRGLAWWMDLLTTYIWLGTTNNYSATANLYNSRITTAPAKPSPACLSSQSFPGNGVSQWRFFSLKRSSPFFTDSRTQLTWSDSLYDWRFTASQFVLATSPLRLTTSNFIFQLNACGYSPYVTSSPMRGLVFVYNCCRSSPAQSFSDPSPAGLMTTFYCLIRNSPTWRARFPYFYPSGTGWPCYTSRHWVPLSSPSTFRRVTVEVL